MIYYLAARFRKKNLVRISTNPLEIMLLRQGFEREGIPVESGSAKDLNELARKSCVKEALGGII